MPNNEGERPDLFLPLRALPSETLPLLRGPDIITEGYYELETSERHAAVSVMNWHTEPVALWYRSLTLYFRGMMNRFDFSGFVDDHTLLLARNLQALLLDLGTSSAKASLDALLAGYYSVAYAAIRHMIESYVGCHYVGVLPENSRRWYDTGEAHDPKEPPKCWEMIRELKSAEGENDAGKAEWNEIYTAWRNMSIGSHPTGAGLYQTVGTVEGERFVVGSTYKRHLCFLGFDSGLWVVDRLLHVLSEIRTMDDKWVMDRLALRTDIARWRRAVHTEQDAPAQ